MKFIVTVPESYPAERNYILYVILKEFLGLDYVVFRAGKKEVCIYDNDKIHCIKIPDCLFAIPETQWLTKESLPKHPLQIWDFASLGIGDLNRLSPIPVIYGTDLLNVDNRNYLIGDFCVQLPIDIFGSAFFMLTRYEEIVNRQRDEHDRFPAKNSLAYKNNFLDRPIVDEYVEILWLSMKRLWPNLTRKTRYFTMCVSHDVDEPSRYRFLKIPRLTLAMCGDIVFRHNIRLAFKGPVMRFNSGQQIHHLDPYNTFDFIMDISERYGLISAFYFICGLSNKNYDVNYRINHPVIRNLLRYIHKRGHEIGLHPSYGTYKSPEKIVTEAQYLKLICKEEGIQQAKWGGRMHYLRWKTPNTLYGWEKAEMTYDSTMSYADHTGFRCGTCHEYPAFDPIMRKTFKLRMRPLTAMECTLIDDKYMGLGVTGAAYSELKKLKSSCRAVNGMFTLLWHNSRFTTNQERELYEAVIKA